MKFALRIASIGILACLLIGPAYLIFNAVSHAWIGTPPRVIVFPKDFVGLAVVVKDPVNGVDLKRSGFFSPEIIIPIPFSGFLAVKDFEPFHWMAMEKVILDDGTLIDGTSPWGQYPSRFRYFGGADRKLEKKLEKYKEEYNHLDCMVYELAKTPQFKNFIPRKEPQKAEQGAAANP